MNHIKNEQMQFISDLNTSKRKLLPAEEHTLVNFIVESANQGLPLNHDNIKKYSNILLQARKGPEFKPVEHQWVFNFLNHWHNELQTHWSKSLDIQCGVSLNPEAVKG